MTNDINGSVDIDERNYLQIKLLPGETAITHCVLNNYVKLLVNTLDDEANQTAAATLINERNEDGKAPLELCAILGRGDIIRELLKRGSDVDLTNCAGYTAAHYAAAWDQTMILKLLVEFNADLTKINNRDESPRETAMRYGQMECVDYIDWAEAKKCLLVRIRCIQEMLIEPERRPHKDDKNLIINTCKEKLEWVENSAMATTQDFISQQATLDSTLATVLAKLSAPRK